MSNGRSQDCSACKQGQYGAKNLMEDPIISCKECPAGYKQELSKMNFCNSCNEGRYSLSGRSACTRCPAGWSAKKGFGNGTCHICPAGYKSSSESSTCSVCLAGFAAIEQSSECDQCNQGKYQNISGASTCRSCQDLDTINTLFYQD
jgi:hypothetical protein